MQNEYFELYRTERASLQAYSEQLLSRINCKCELAELQTDIHMLLERRDSLLALYEKLRAAGYASNNKLAQTDLIVEKLKNLDLTVQLQNQGVTDADVYEQMQQLVTVLFSLVQAEQLEWAPYNKKSFLVDTWTFLLRNLEKVSVFYVVRKLLPKEYVAGNTRFVDKWLIGHLLLALIFVFAAGAESVPTWLKYTLLIYGCVRMFEVSIYQLNVILVHPYVTSNYSLASYRRMTIALIHNFFEFIFWFAGTFVTMQFINDASAPLAFYTSFIHMVTYSFDTDDSKLSVITVAILQFQALIGVFMTMLSFARFVSLFPQPASKDPKEQEAEDERYNEILEVMRDNNAHILAANEQITKLADEQRDLMDRLDRQGVVQ
ncbi:MAG: hypothetical protein ABS948_01095 [Solibacillus sp.]